MPKSLRIVRMLALLAQVSLLFPTLLRVKHIERNRVSQGPQWKSVLAWVVLSTVPRLLPDPRSPVGFFTSGQKFFLALMQCPGENTLNELLALDLFFGLVKIPSLISIIALLSLLVYVVFEKSHNIFLFLRNQGSSCLSLSSTFTMNCLSSSLSSAHFSFSSSFLLC